MIGGISAGAYSRLIDVCRSTKGLHRVLLFGSRAKGTHTSYSDIDLAFDGEDVGEDFVYRLKDAAGVYRLDAINLKTNDNLVLLDEIREFGILFYESDDRISKKDKF